MPRDWRDSLSSLNAAAALTIMLAFVATPFSIPGVTATSWVILAETWHEQKDAGG